MKSEISAISADTRATIHSQRAAHRAPDGTRRCLNVAPFSVRLTSRVERVGDATPPRSRE